MSKFSWGFLVSLLSLFWAVFTWWDAGNEEELTPLDHQNALLSSLIEETKKSREGLITLVALSKQQLAGSAPTESGAGDDDLRSSTTGDQELPPTEDTTLRDSSKDYAAVQVDVPQPPVDPVASADQFDGEKNTAIGKAGWIYLGRFNAKRASWDSSYNKTIKGHKDENARTGEELTIDVSVGFNDGPPRFPRYEAGLSRTYPFVLSPGTVVKVLNLEDEIGLRNFTWAEVQIVEML